MACPCKQKFTEEQKALLNDQMGKSFVQNPNGAAAGALSSSLGTALTKANGIANLIGVTTGPNLSKAEALRAAGVDVTKMNALTNGISNMKSKADAFKSQADLMSNPQYLMSVIGSMNFYANIGCALGIEGLDITASVGVISGKGGSTINVAGAVNADLGKILDNFNDTPYGGNVTAAANAFSQGLEGITNKINDAATAVGDVTKKCTDMIDEGLAKVGQFSQVNFFSNLLKDANDPCNKLGVELKNGGLFTPEFQSLSAAATASTSGGSTSR
jgi:hypothetical protein